MFVMQAFYFQNSEDSKKITEKSNELSHVKLHQAYMFDIQPFDFQTSKETTKITQKLTELPMRS